MGYITPLAVIGCGLILHFLLLVDLSECQRSGGGNVDSAFSRCNRQYTSLCTAGFSTTGLDCTCACSNGPCSAACCRAQVNQSQFGVHRVESAVTRCNRLHSNVCSAGFSATGLQCTCSCMDGPCSESCCRSQISVQVRQNDSQCSAVDIISSWSQCRALYSNVCSAGCPGSGRGLNCTCVCVDGPCSAACCHAQG